MNYNKHSSLVLTLLCLVMLCFTLAYKPEFSIPKVALGLIMIYHGVLSYIQYTDDKTLD